MRSDWCRNTNWNDAIEAEFRKRLRRARAFNQVQYRRVQAVYLVTTHPRVALQLLDEYFALGGDVLWAFALSTRAQAYRELGDIEEALRAYEACLDYEAANSGVRGSAYLEYPRLVMELRRRDKYERVLQLFASWDKEEIFAVQTFTRCAAMAVIHDDLGRAEEARLAAVAALGAAGVSHSGMRYHPRVGLVGDLAVEVEALLVRLAGGIT